MAEGAIHPDDLGVVPIGPAAENDIASFDAGDDWFGQELTAFLRERALAEHTRRLSFTELFYIRNDLVAYVTTSAAVIRNRVRHDAPAQIADVPYPDVPALLLGRMAVARQHQGRRIGLTLLQWVENKARTLRTGCRLITLHVARDNVRAAILYQRYGSSPLNTCVLPRDIS
jgi:GNAT superfamily N-acetyltransferase